MIIFGHKSLMYLNIFAIDYGIWAAAFIEAISVVGVLINKFWAMPLLKLMYTADN